VSGFSEGTTAAIDNIVGSFSQATRAAIQFGDAETAAGKAAALVAGATAIAQATSQGNQRTRTIGGATTGAQIGFGIAGPYGALVGAGVGALTGFIRGQHEEERRVNDIRDAFVSAHGELSALNEEAHKAGKTLDDLLHAKNVRDYNAAVNDLNSAFEKQSRTQSGISSLGAKSGTELRQAALDAADVFEFMRKSGDYTADQVGKAPSTRCARRSPTRVTPRPRPRSRRRARQRPASMN
jgi:hypothetical protein